MPAVLALGTGPVQFEELGSTLFSTIDKLEKLNIAYRSLFRSINNLNYVGIEVSQLLIDLAEMLHPESNLKHYSVWQDIPRLTPNIVSRSYQSTSYAFRQTDELFDWMAKSKFGIHGVWWCIDGGQRHIMAAGNPITLFDPDYFNTLAEKSGYQIKVIKSELFSYCNIRFSASWVILSRLDPLEIREMDTLLRQMSSEPAPTVCSLTRAGLLAQTYAGRHAGFIPVQTDSPFDFQSEQLVSQWDQYIQGT